MKLETRNLSLTEQLEALSTVKSISERVPKNDGGGVLRKKFNYVFIVKNPGLQLLEAINGNNIPDNMTPNKLNSLQFSPLTSIDVERSFFSLQTHFNSRRHRFWDINLERNLIVNYNSSALA